MIISFLIATIFAPLIVATMDFCGVYQNMISGPTAFTVTYKEIIPTDVSSKIEVCLFGDGDITK